MKAFRSCRLQQQITLFRFDQKKLRRLRPAAKVCSTLLPKLSVAIFLLGALTAFLRKTPDHRREPAGAVPVRPLSADRSARSRAHHRFDRLRLSGRRSRSAALRPDPHWCIHRGRSAKAPSAACPGRTGRSGIRSAGGRPSAFSAKLYRQPPLYGAGFL